MPHRNRNYRDLAQAVSSELKKRKLGGPAVDVLIRLFESMYFASLRAEESQPILFHVVYLDPDNPDPDPPENISNDRWMFVPLRQPIQVTIGNLIKIAKASDPRTSSFAVYNNTAGRLFVWGLVDQGNSYNDFVNYESEEGPEPPGLFQASIAGIGHLVAFIEWEKIAELKINELVTAVPDIFWGGPIHDALVPGIEAHLKAVRKKFPPHVYQARGHWDMSLRFNWIASLCRLLLRIQKYHHGGAVLIIPGDSSRGLNIKYKLQYARLRQALEKKAILEVSETHTSDRIWEEYIEVDLDEIPVDLYLDESVARNRMEQSRREIDGTLWFVSLLTRVDGLVLLNKHLEVQGFGVEITYSEEPSNILLAGNRSGTKSKLRKLDYNHYGTRHRSMMRYCSRMPGSIGFVISQDGDVRAMTVVRGSLVVWENIKLQFLDFVRRASSKNKRTSS